MKYNLEYTYEENREIFLEEIQKEYYSPKDLCVEEVEGGIVVPSPLRNKLDYPKEIVSREGGVIDKDGKFIVASKRHLLRYKMDYVNTSNLKNIVFRNETVCYLGPIAGYWGHILTEISSCLWYAIRNPNLKWVYYDYTDPKETLIRKPLLDFLELFGIKKEQLIPVTQPTQFSKVIVPEMSAILSEYYTKEFKNTFNYIRDKYAGDCKEQHKIYLTKSEFESEKGSQIGELTFKKIFEKNGYLCVAPERLSVKEQVRVFANAAEIIAPEGTLPHNILFCRDNVKITIINRKMGVNNFQLAINQMRKAEVVYLDCWYMLLPVYHGPYIFSVNSNFRRYAKANNIKIEVRDNQYIEEYLKIIWYILKYLQLYDISDEGGQLRKVWTSKSVENFLVSRRHMDFLNEKEADKISNSLQEFIRKIVE